MSRVVGHHLVALDHNGETDRDESEWRARCSCGWEESCRVKREVRREYSWHLSEVRKRRSDGAALCVSKPVRVAAMAVTDAVLRTFQAHMNFCIDTGAESHRRMRAACVDAAADVLDGRVRDEES